MISGVDAATTGWIRSRGPLASGELHTTSAVRNIARRSATTRQKHPPHCTGGATCPGRARHEALRLILPASRRTFHPRRRFEFRRLIWERSSRRYSSAWAWAGTIEHSWRACSCRTASEASSGTARDIRDGKLNPRATVTVVSESHVTIHLHGDGELGYLASGRVA